ncbi:MAG: aconitase X swivel domain-containing protein [Vulcanisaeta sp. AZ3]|jgi:predicted aconitase with swiveling domain
MRFKGYTLFGSGVVEGELVVYKEPLSFLGDVDGRSGIIRTVNVSIVGKVLAIPSSRGSTVGPYVMYQLMKYGKAPRVILSVKADTMLIIGAVMAQIPIVTNLPREVLNLPSGSLVHVDLDRGEVYVDEHGG